MLLMSCATFFFVDNGTFLFQRGSTFLIMDGLTVVLVGGVMGYGALIVVLGVALLLVLCLYSWSTLSSEGVGTYLLIHSLVLCLVFCGTFLNNRIKSL